MKIERERQRKMDKILWHWVKWIRVDVEKIYEGTWRNRGRDRVNVERIVREKIKKKKK